MIYCYSCEVSTSWNRFNFKPIFLYIYFLFMILSEICFRDYPIYLEKEQFANWLGILRVSEIYFENLDSYPRNIIEHPSFAKYSRR